MSAEQLFSVSNSIALAGWLVLIIVPKWKFTYRLILCGIVVLLSLLYTVLIVTNFRLTDLSGFSTLSGLQNLFSDQQLLLAGWVHYLAFDLMTGLFIIKNSQKHHISHWLVIPCLFFTFMLGPVGLLLFLTLKLSNRIIIK